MLTLPNWAAENRSYLHLVILGFILFLHSMNIYQVSTTPQGPEKTAVSVSMDLLVRELQEIADIIVTQDLVLIVKILKIRQMKIFLNHYLSIPSGTSL